MVDVVEAVYVFFLSKVCRCSTVNIYIVTDDAKLSSTENYYIVFFLA